MVLCSFNVIYVVHMQGFIQDFKLGGGKPVLCRSTAN